MSTVTVGLVRLHRHFNELPEDSQGIMAVEGKPKTNAYDSLLRSNTYSLMRLRSR